MVWQGATDAAVAVTRGEGSTGAPEGAFARATGGMAAERIVLYPGSFDPVTNGHVDVIRRAARLFDRVIVAVGVNTGKEPLFSVAERMAHLRQVCAGIGVVEVSSFGGLLTAAVRDFGAVAVIRGLRAVSDFEYEFQMALMNRELSPQCETVFLMPSPAYSFVSSTMIREIVRLGGDVSPFVPLEISDEVYRRIRGAS
jgi:pantetheine-phosphate adenylyltransferase